MVLMKKLTGAQYKVSCSECHSEIFQGDEFIRGNSLALCSSCCGEILELASLIPEVESRETFCDGDEYQCYFESDEDFVLKNIDACVQFLERVTLKKS